MTETKLQFDIVMWFNNNYKTDRGSLFAIQNETNKGAYKKGLGLVPGASDLGHILETGVFCAFELKAPNARHVVKHLKRQSGWLQLVNKRGGVGFFIFSVKHFQHAIDNCKLDNERTHLISKNSLDFIANCIEIAEEKGTKTVKLDWKDDYIYRPIKSIKR